MCLSSGCTCSPPSAELLVILPASTTLHNPGEQHMRMEKVKFTEAVCSADILGRDVARQVGPDSYTYLWYLGGLWKVWEVIKQTATTEHHHPSSGFSSSPPLCTYASGYGLCSWHQVVELPPFLSFSNLFGAKMCKLHGYVTYSCLYWALVSGFGEVSSGSHNLKKGKRQLI